MKKRIAPILSQQASRSIKWLLLIFAVGIFAFLYYPNLISYQHEYQLGDIADRDIKAPRDFFVEDRAATETNRQVVVEQVLTVYDYDPRIAQLISEKVRTAFSLMRVRLKEIEAKHTLNEEYALGDDGLVPEKNSSGMVNMEATDAETRPIAISDETNPSNSQESEKVISDYKDEFANAMGIEVSSGSFKLLAVESFSSRISELIIRIISEIMANGVVANKEVLLKEAEKGVVLRDVVTQTEKTILALRQYYGPDQAKTMVRIIAEPLVKDFNYNIINLIVDYCQILVQPNITLNRNETEKRKTQALDSVKPIMYKIKAGEMVLREGERVSAVQLLKLNEMARLSENKPLSTSGIGAAVIMATSMIIGYLIYFSRPRHVRQHTYKNLLFLTLILVAVFLMAKFATTIETTLIPNTSVALPPNIFIFAMPLAAAPILVCLLLGFEIAVVYGAISAICAALLYGGRLEVFFFIIINNTLAAYWVQDCRERKLIVIAGLKLGLLNVFLALTVSVFVSEHFGIKMLWEGTFAFLGGIGASIIALGLAPLVEMAFGYATDITLLELANLDRPILRRLMIEAPGTYHHSMIVGSMVEAAAGEIGANPLLARVSAYYHDIGKVKKPPYFIENQTSGYNKHDKLAPSMSSLILIAHVKDGIEIAQKNKLGQVIIDTIQQHHGTSLISYFYEKAKQRKGEDAVNIDDFRYPGPKPQTKETGLVMLADVVEAASRTLENPTPARIQGMVQHLINKVFSDGQLDNCELTLKDLHSIAKSFNKILYGIHHHRIEYAESTSREAKEGIKLVNGSSDRQSAEKSPHRNQKNPKEGTGHLKRLGLS